MPEITFSYERFPNGETRRKARDLVSERYPFYGFSSGPLNKPDTCAMYSPSNFVCTRKQDHEGPHVGHYEDRDSGSVWWNTRLPVADQALVVMLRLLQ